MHHCKVRQIPVPELNQRWASIVFVAMFTLLMIPATASSDEAPLAPSELYTPQQVVVIVVDSLQQNAADDAGIATVFRFASPGNKAGTGPLSRFTRMIKGGFSDMLNHVGGRYEPIEIEGDLAVQAVWLETQTGAEYGYAFQLSKQRGGIHDGMWMTDAVVPLGKNKNSGMRI